MSPSSCAAAAKAKARAASARRRSAAATGASIELDESGHHKLFFQFVPVEDAQPFFTQRDRSPASSATLLSMRSRWRSARCIANADDSTLLDAIAEAAFRGWRHRDVALGVSAAACAGSSCRTASQQASLAFSRDAARRAAVHDLPALRRHQSVRVARARAR